MGRLGAGRIGHWVEAAPPSEPLFARGAEGTPVRGLQSLLSLYGYDIEANGVYDARTEAVMTAFQRHFRAERVDGEADESSVEALAPPYRGAAETQYLMKQYQYLRVNLR